MNNISDTSISQRSMSLKRLLKKKSLHMYDNLTSDQMKKIVGNGLTNAGVLLWHSSPAFKDRARIKTSLSGRH